MTLDLDRRLHAFRPDLADLNLEGRVEADRFTAGRPARVAVPVADLKARPDASAGNDTQLLFGEAVTIFDTAGGWHWVQAAADGYVGYLRADQAADAAAQPAPTHRIAAVRTFVYPGPDLRHPPVSALSAGSLVTITGEAETRGTRYALLADGTAIIADHALPVGEPVDADFVAIAARFIETPYLWGGRSGFGIDCSGLVQLSMALAGRAVPRDSDMQANGLGTPIEPGPDLMGLKRGDLVFWKGHVGIMEDAETLLHANGHTMRVNRERLADAIERTARLYARPTGFRRP